MAPAPRPIPSLSVEDIERFDASFVERDLGYDTLCHFWISTLFAQGYACFTLMEGDEKRNVRGHRVSWFLKYGNTDHQLDHLCHDPKLCAGGPTCPHRRCVNPDHLKITTPRENTLRSNALTAQNARKTHCDHGHEFTAENTFLDAGGWRQCRTCRNRRARERVARNRDQINARRRELRERIAHKWVHCEGCGVLFMQIRSDQKFHDVNCRQRTGYRRRHQ